MSKPYLILVVALSCEAKAIRQMGEWKRDNAALKGCQLYNRSDKSMSMIVSGSGKIASALASSWLCEKLKNKLVAIINIGVAGKVDGNIGDLFWINKVTEQSTKKVWFPQSPTKHGLATAGIVTCDQVQSKYPVASLVDMEASGFIQAATKWVNIENIIVLKCVSDNQTTDLITMQAEDIFKSLAEKINVLENIFDAVLLSLRKFEQVRVKDQDYANWFDQWHFTFTQQHQLKDHLHALKVLNPDMEYHIHQYKHVHSAKEVIKLLKDQRIELSGCLYHE